MMRDWSASLRRTTFSGQTLAARVTLSPYSGALLGSLWTNHLVSRFDLRVHNINTSMAVFSPLETSEWRLREEVIQWFDFSSLAIGINFFSNVVISCAVAVARDTKRVSNGRQTDKQTVSQAATEHHNMILFACRRVYTGTEPVKQFRGT